MDDGPEEKLVRLSVPVRTGPVPVADASGPLVPVGVASAVEGMVMPAGLNPLSAQYCTCTVDKISRSVCVFMLAKVQLAEAQRVINDMRKSRFPLLHQHRELSHPFRPLVLKYLVKCL